MNRRQFLSISALSISLSGCIEGDFGGTTRNNSTTPKTETLSPEGVTPECWPSMCKGTKLVEVFVALGVSGDVVLQAECRGEEFPIRSGESAQLDREEDAETCEISVSIDGEQVYRENVEDYESVTLTVSSSGEVEEERVTI
ncbi:hypothetical protein [Haloprofundus salinisoli]|uniref:hypothetical protein n=1 Tax=Haloprofundus salinisoli TaxID=2876193 RepID=UPI001CCFEF23|nr:hypothetical protein [Haloprofundus salinisoli]